MYKKSPHVCIIILNFNGYNDTLECIRSLFEINYPNYIILVIDNGSEDESIQKIQEQFKNQIINFLDYNESDLKFKVNIKPKVNDLDYNKKIIIIKNDYNYGFAEGNNIGIKYALNNLNVDYILLLNNDTIVEKEFIKHLIHIGENNENIGILGSTVYYNNNPRMIQSAGAMIQWNKGKQTLFGFKESDHGQFIKPKEVDYVSGCSMIIKAELFSKIGYLNSKYFAYWEETDFCVRAYSNGYKTFHVPKSKIWHKASLTSKKMDGFYAYYMTRNMFWFMKQHASTKQLISFTLYFFMIQIWRTGADFFIYHGKFRALTSFLKGIVDGIITNP